ncbi:TorF family putative porin [Paucibacter sp. B2R-40]|uniref:TorF family putative porin n=1 Tax=Paucibacter sp. B2R-40 TaxID=2893554 RepID=UPI0021E48AA3|nr:TorF family putative porin [Paucibacter sp. B2R-40]MCV2353182.1 TorF family putative porin [Paucibacter sp. B2R-40]
MKSIFAVLAVTLTLGATMAQAEEAAKTEAAPEAAGPLSFNVSLTSDYRYRGISQSRLKPALQGGADYAAANGFYIGTWASTIKWIKDAPYNGGANVEIDVYGGYKTEIASGLTLDVGALTYVYPSNDLPTSANTTEIYGALSYGPVTAKYSHSVTNLFGTADSKGSGYLDVSATFDVGGGFTVVPHVGYQKVKNNSAGSYTDYSLTLNKDYAGFTFGAAVVGTNTDAYVGGPDAKNLGKDSLVVSVKKTF